MLARDHGRSRGLRISRLMMIMTMITTNFCRNVSVICISFSTDLIHIRKTVLLFNKCLKSHPETEAAATKDFCC
jgi:hypothetical protein